MIKIIKTIVSFFYKKQVQNEVKLMIWGKYINTGKLIVSHRYLTIFKYRYKIHKHTFLKSKQQFIIWNKKINL